MKRPTWNLALGTLAFALCFTSWSLIAPFAKTFKHNLGLNYTQALLLTAVPVVLGSLLRIPMGVLTDRYGGRLIFSVLLAVSALPAILFGYADSYWALIGVGFLLGVAGASFAVGVPFVSGWYSRERQGFALGVYGIGNIGTAIAFFGAPAIVDHWSRPALGWVTGIALLRGGLAVLLVRPQRAANRAADALPRGAPLGLAALPARGLLLHHLRRLRGDGVPAADAAAGLVRLLEGRGERPRGGLHHRRHGRPARRRLARRPRRRLPGARARLRRDRDRRGGAGRDRAGAADRPGVDRLPHARRVPRRRATARSSSSSRAEFPNDAGAAAGIVGAAGGLGGFFPPVFVGLVKDAEGTYTYGFVGLLVFVGVCLALAVWLLRNAPSEPSCAARRA